MIGYLQGTLLVKESDRLLVLANQIGFEVLLPAFVADAFQQHGVGDEVALYIFFHQSERQPKPVLIGFSNEQEKAFFQLFLTVEDMGPLKAIKSLSQPIHETAAAIEGRDIASLCRLKGIGKRMAEKVIASLKGKMESFLQTPVSPASGVPLAEQNVQVVLDVLTLQLGYKLAEARQLLTAVLERNPLLSRPEDILDEVFRRPPA